jgi:hypothetical protein
MPRARTRAGLSFREVTTHLRTVIAAIVGVLSAVLLWYFGLVIFVLTTIGIPLGSESRPQTPTESLILLLLAGAAAAVGGRIAARIAGARRQAAVWAVCAMLGAIMVWGFSGRNSWPDWWGPAVALSMVVGAYIGGVSSHARHDRPT